MRFNAQRSKYFLTEERKDTAHTAWAKAPSDVAAIAMEMGFVPLSICNKSNLKWPSIIRRLLLYWKLICNGVGLEHRSLVLLQHPINRLFPGRLGMLLGVFFLRAMIKLTRSTTVAIVHDLEEIRMWLTADVGGTSRDTKNLLRLADIIIVHNKRMAKWLQQKNCYGRRLVPLQLFDYLASGYEPLQKIPFRRCVTIAGNLRMDKARYLRHLKEIGKVEWHLYGNRYDEANCGADNIHYHGVFPPDKLLREMINGFGLVWDGNSVDTCSGGTGEYLRYNNPHKLSMYLAAGLPVIVWSGSAVAELVIKAGCGLVVDSLRQIEGLLKTIDELRYIEIRNQAIEMSRKVRAGYFTKTALAEVIKMANRE